MKPEDQPSDITGAMPVPPPDAPASKGTREDSSVGRCLTRRDRDLILALEKAIDDPATSADMRDDYREALGSIGMGYIDIFDEEEEREYLATLNPKDLLTEAEWQEFSNRKRS
jgi:hypothetical protein